MLSSNKTLTPLQGRFLKWGFDVLSEQETIELLLCIIMPPRECKRWARKLIKEFDNNKQEEITIRASVTTDRIMIRARGLSSVSTTQANRRGVFFGTTRSIDAPDIQEIELYGFK